MAVLAGVAVVGVAAVFGCDALMSLIIPTTICNRFHSKTEHSKNDLISTRTFLKTTHLQNLRSAYSNKTGEMINSHFSIVAFYLSVGSKLGHFFTMLG